MGRLLPVKPIGYPDPGVDGVGVVCFSLFLRTIWEFGFCGLKTKHVAFSVSFRVFRGEKEKPRRKTEVKVDP